LIIATTRIASTYTEHVTDLTTTGTDVTSRDIGISANVTRQLQHEGVALERFFPISRNQRRRLRGRRSGWREKDTHESPDLVVGLSLGVKVATTLTATHHETGEGVLEDLLETEAGGSDSGSFGQLRIVRPAIATATRHSQLQDGEVDGRVQPQTALVRTEGRVELNTVTTVDLDVTLVVLPGDAELDDTLGDLKDLERATVGRVLLEELGVGGAWSAGAL
jgi:hypothetical protein